MLESLGALYKCPHPQSFWFHWSGVSPGHQNCKSHPGDSKVQMAWREQEGSWKSCQVTEWELRDWENSPKLEGGLCAEEERSDIQQEGKTAGFGGCLGIEPWPLNAQVQATFVSEDGQRCVRRWAMDTLRFIFQMASLPVSESLPPCSLLSLPAQHLAHSAPLWSHAALSDFLISFSLPFSSPSQIAELPVSQPCSLSSPSITLPFPFFLISHAVSLYITPWFSESHLIELERFTQLPRVQLTLPPVIPCRAQARDWESRERRGLRTLRPAGLGPSIQIAKGWASQETESPKEALCHHRATPFQLCLGSTFDYLGSKTWVPG